MKKLNKTKKYLVLLFFALILMLIILFIFSRQFPFKGILTKPKISYLDFKDLQKLSKSSRPHGPLYLKLQKQLVIPFVQNKSEFVLRSKFERPYLRVAQWNIERGMNIEAIKQIILSPTSYYYSYKNNLTVARQKELKKEAHDFSKSDIILLNEVDIGMPRTKYKNIAAELADSIGYNYAFAPEFIELTPVIYSTSLLKKDKYLGLHGNAIVSKFPIKNARIVRLPQCYDWYLNEINKRSPLEHARRFGAKKVFDQSIISEVRHGSRCALVADIQLPNKETVTVVSLHLEDRCYPSCRYKQMEYFLKKIKYARNPVVIGGDLNTTTTDSAPTSFRKEISKRLKDPHYLARQAILAFAPIGIPLPGVANLASFAISKTFQYKDPAAHSIPVLFPNQERKLFNYIRDFTFADGESFDDDGYSNKSSNGKRGLFANSNERQLKGFESTFKLEEPRGIGYFKLDWFFVKPKSGRFKPFNGQTLQLINNSYPGKVSDHEPITVDITL